MKFATKLMLLISGLIFVILVAVTYSVYASYTRTIEHMITDTLEEQAFHTIDKIDRTMFERIADTKTLATDSVLRDPGSSAEAITERLIQYRNRYKTYSSISFFNPQRIKIADTSGIDIGKQHRKTTYWGELGKGSVFAMGMGFSESLGRAVFFFASAVNDSEGRIIGYVVSRMPVEKLHYMTNQASGIHRSRERFKIDLVDSRGLLLYSNHNIKGVGIEVVPRWEEFYLANIKNSRSGYIRHAAPDNEIDVFVKEPGYLDFPGNGWTLIVHAPRDVIFKPARDLRDRIIILLGVTGVIGTAVAAFFSRTISRPVSDLTTAAEKVTLGDFSVNIKTGSKDEIGQFSETFRKMVDELKHHRERAQAYKAELENTVRERTDDLIKANERLVLELAEKKRAEDALKESEERYRTIVGNISIGVFRCSGSPYGFFIQANPAMAQIFGYKRGEMASGLPLLFDTREESDRFKDELLEKGLIINKEVLLRRSDGASIWTMTSASAHYGPGGDLKWIDGIIEDINERKLYEEKLKDLSLSDELTGLYNRRGFLTLAEQELKMANRMKRGMVLLFADLDCMKEINDRFGHHEGDRALKDLAYILRDTFRESDIVSRIGGDEFAALAMETTELDGKTISERLVGKLEIFNGLDIRPYKLSLSLGVTHYDPDKPITLEELLDRSDKLMYAEKKLKKGAAAR